VLFPFAKGSVMPISTFDLPDEPTAATISALVQSLRDDSARRGVSPRNYSHRLRVIRQQKLLLAKRCPGAS
jgi:hypothetical protein